jgi:hypothetical protein
MASNSDSKSLDGYTNSVSCIRGEHLGTLACRHFELCPPSAIPTRNNSKGCGAVVRSAPVGLFAQSLGLSPQDAFRLGFDLAALTGHPTSGLRSEFLVVIIMGLADGASLPAVFSTAKDCLSQEPHHEETLAAVEMSVFLAFGLPSEANSKRASRGT